MEALITKVNLRRDMMNLLAIDMDGTLLNSRNEVSDTQLSLLENILENNLAKVVIATGRPIEGVQTMLPESIFKQVYLLGLNGGVLLDQNKQLLGLSTFDPSDVADIVNHAESVNANLGIMDGQHFYNLTEPLTSQMEFDISINRMKFVPINKEETLAKEDVTKVVFFMAPEEQADLLTSLPVEFYDRFSVIVSQNYLIEVQPKGVTKGKRLLELAAHLEIGKEDIVSIGDGANDFELLKVAGTAIAMENAVEDLKVYADHITLHHDEDGVKHAIHHYTSIMKEK